jgi:ABC-type transporter MlaC component
MSIFSLFHDTYINVGMHEWFFYDIAINSIWYHTTNRNEWLWYI